MTPNWYQHRYCATNENPDHWVDDAFAGNGVHWCRRHCPVFAQCKAEQEANPQPGVYAGVLWVQTFSRGRMKPLPTRVATHQPKELQCTHCQHLSVMTARETGALSAVGEPGATVSTGRGRGTRSRSDAA